MRIAGQIPLSVRPGLSVACAARTTATTGAGEVAGGLAGCRTAVAAVAAGARLAVAALPAVACIRGARTPAPVGIAARTTGSACTRHAVATRSTMARDVERPAA